MKTFNSSSTHLPWGCYCLAGWRRQRPRTPAAASGEKPSALRTAKQRQQPARSEPGSAEPARRHKPPPRSHRSKAPCVHTHLRQTHAAVQPRRRCYTTWPHTCSKESTSLATSRAPPLRENLPDFSLTLRSGWDQPLVPRHVRGQPWRQLPGTNLSARLLRGVNSTYTHGGAFPSEPWARRLAPAPPEPALPRGTLPETRAWAGGWWRSARHVVLSRQSIAKVPAERAGEASWAHQHVAKGSAEQEEAVGQLRTRSPGFQSSSGGRWPGSIRACGREKSIPVSYDSSQEQTVFTTVREERSKVEQSENIW